MGFDAFVLAALVSELSPSLLGSRVGRVIQPSREEVALAFGPSGRESLLLISAHPALFHLRLGDAVDAPSAPPGNFALLLRRHLEGLRLQSMRQPELERLLTLVFENSEHEFPRTRLHLHVHLIPRATNIVLTDAADRVLGSLSRGPEPGDVYQAPPALPQLTPLTVTPELFAQAILLATPEARVVDLLVKHFRGLSPPLAKEILYRSGLPTDATRGDLTGAGELWRQFAALMRSAATGDWSPGISSPDGGGTGELSAFPLTLSHSFRHYQSMNVAVTAYFSQRMKVQRLTQIRSGLLRHVRNLHARALRKAEAQQDEVNRAADASWFRHCGELVLANLSDVRAGAKTAEVIDYLTGAGVVIPLDPLLSPTENAQHFFKRYHKAKRAQVAAREQLQRTRTEAEYLAQVLVTLEQSEAAVEVEAIREELVEEGFVKPSGKRGKPQGKQGGFNPRRYVTSDGHEVLVGRNNKENERLTLKTGAPNDWWLHAKDIPGAHVILRVPQDSQPPETALLEAAAIAAYHSQARDAGRTPVDYTRRRHVWKTPGGRPGQVLYDHHKTLYASPALPSQTGE